MNKLQGQIYMARMGPRTIDSVDREDNLLVKESKKKWRLIGSHQIGLKCFIVVVGGIAI